ncbi:hypothetical protein D3C77_302250 [compost metagenome]
MDLITWLTMESLMHDGVVSKLNVTGWKNKMWLFIQHHYIQTSINGLPRLHNQLALV